MFELLSKRSGLTQMFHRKDQTDLPRFWMMLDAFSSQHGELAILRRYNCTIPLFCLRLREALFAGSLKRMFAIPSAGSRAVELPGVQTFRGW